MVDFIEKVDDFFSGLIEDEVGRFCFMHLPFLGLIVYLIWNLTESLGLYLIWVVVVFVATPYLIAKGLFKLYESRHYERNQIRFRWSVVLYAISVPTFIGVPHLYYGLFIKLLQSALFAKAYWNVIMLWWKLFNFYHDYKRKDLQNFLKPLVFSFDHWQICFLISAVVIAPLLFYRRNLKARMLELAQEREVIRYQKERAEQLAKERADEEHRLARKLAYEERLRQEREAEQIVQKKLQAKINEVKGKDPWESGFL